MIRLSIACLLSALASAQTLPLVDAVEHQPFAAQVERILDTLKMIGEPMPAAEETKLRGFMAVGTADSVRQIQAILDARCLVGIVINPESRVKVAEGPARPELIEQGWRTFFVKVQNQAGVTAVLNVSSRNAGLVANAPEGTLQRRFLDLQMWNKQPMKERLSGLGLEYRLLQIYSRESGSREARLSFDVGQGSQDLGFRSDVDILFKIRKATAVKLRVRETDGTPVTAGFIIRDTLQRVYPAQAKRLAPDFFFQPQIYRADGETLLLPPGDYAILCTRGPEYAPQTRKVHVGTDPTEVSFILNRWIDPAKLGWFSGDHHVHAAGCAHYDRPTEGVYPQDMIRHILGEDLKVGSVLSWGPGWYFQKTFFEGKDNPLSTKTNLMHYDVEVSGFPSSHAGHLILLGLTEEDYPGTKRIEDWPTWGLPILQWGKKQNAVVGYAHSGWGLQLKEEKLPTDEIPPYDGIGANEYIVTVTHGAVDFI